ncbi:MerR family transcriptional regulator [Radiobacillus deserti]|uniref:MerR family transcriptional regulator n=1 Tax=Radiobacillus deserti TaxID=2594883 RepID=A0A516KD97_9BACI|nr:MerR family transcriptional regulator [Radiobacillus deserti]QDP39276.1 MerR family transcriptional regulator [Radiobacillus deserti]
MTYLSTGEVAKKLNVSLRTIRYYDNIDLVKPTMKKEDGTRFYTPDDIVMLQKVLLLKATSMPLKNIEKVINHITIQEVLAIHKEQLEQDFEQLSESLSHTNTLINTVKLEGDIQWEHLLPLLLEDRVSRQKRKTEAMDDLFTDEEQMILSEQLPKMETDSTDVTKWMNIIKRIELCLAEGKSPRSEEGRLIAEDTLILSNEMFNGNAELEQKFWEARKSETQSADLNLYPVNNAVMMFMEEAIEGLEKATGK